MPTLPELMASGPVVAAMAALDDLLAQSHKVRVIDSDHNHPGEHGSFLIPVPGGYNILVDETTPNAVGQLVHEICHGILLERGYFIAQYPNNSPLPANHADHLRDAFSNAVLHAEVFRLMQEYGVDMGEYFQHKRDGLLQRLAAIQHQSPHQFVNRQQDVLVFFDAYLMGPLGEVVRTSLNQLFPESHSRCDELRAALPAGGLVTWQAADDFAATFRNNLVSYCQAHHVGVHFTTFWQSLVLQRPQALFPNPPAGNPPAGNAPVGNAPTGSYPHLRTIMLIALALVIVGGVLVWILTR
jgi:hypothetical protein